VDTKCLETVQAASLACNLGYIKCIRLVCLVSWFDDIFGLFRAFSQSAGVTKNRRLIGIPRIGDAEDGDAGAVACVAEERVEAIDVMLVSWAGMHAYGDPKVCPFYNSSSDVVI